jgi:hypothetical protein
MPITYTVEIDFDDSGLFTDPGEDITADVIGAWWRLGMEHPYASVAAPIAARVTLRNLSRDYSPETGVRALQPGKSIRIRSDDGSTLRTHFTGMIDYVQPQAGDQGERTAVIYARGPEPELGSHHITLSAQVEVTADRIVNAALDATPLRRPSLKQRFILDTVNHMELGTNTYLPNDALARSLDVGKSTFAYVADTWADGIPALDAIRQIAESERGRFFIDRLGQAIFLNRHYTLLATTPVATFEDNMVSLAYTYGQDVVNSVEVTITPRSIGAANSVLWTLENPQRILPGEEGIRRLTTQFRDSNDRPIGALAVIEPLPGFDYTVNTAQDGTGTDVTAQVKLRLYPSGSSGDLEVHNRTRNPAYLLAGARIRGTPINQGDPVTVTFVDATSQTFYGDSRIAFTLSALTSIEEADQLARYEVARRKTAHGTVSTLSLDALHQPIHALDRTLFDGITVHESQTNHSADYFIVGETHELDLGGARHRVSWLLESADYNTFWIVEKGNLDQTALLAY